MIFILGNLKRNWFTFEAVFCVGGVGVGSGGNGGEDKRHILGPVYSTPDNIERPAIFLQFGLPFTVTGAFQNALPIGGISLSDGVAITL